jgi:hypothetical protein
MKHNHRARNLFATKVHGSLNWHYQNVIFSLTTEYQQQRKQAENSTKWYPTKRECLPGKTVWHERSTPFEASEDSVSRLFSLARCPAAVLLRPGSRTWRTLAPVSIRLIARSVPIEKAKQKRQIFGIEIILLSNMIIFLSNMKYIL